MRTVFKKSVISAVSLGLIALSGLVLSSCEKKPSSENSGRAAAFAKENDDAVANAQATYEKHQADLAAKKAGGGKPGASPATKASAEAKASPDANASPAAPAPPPGPAKSSGQ